MDQSDLLNNNGDDNTGEDFDLFESAPPTSAPILTPPPVQQPQASTSIASASLPGSSASTSSTSATVATNGARKSRTPSSGNNTAAAGVSRVGRASSAYAQHAGVPTRPANRALITGDEVEDQRSYRTSLEPDDNAVETRNLNARFLNALKAMLLVYIVIYLLESTVGEFSPTGPDMVLLFLGWYASDGYRLRALNLYLTLTVVSVAIDTLGFITSLVFVVSRSFPTWILIVLVILFLVETLFKIASIFQGRALRQHLEIINRLPVESAPLRVV